ncbi:MAG: hypothetical protein P8N61_11015 [Porticoccaceae bacterium]|nr:hypothetical protein [Porticoccaceae bacterium]
MDFLLPVHIVAGSAALIASVFALGSAKGKKAHIRSGRIYFWAMVVIFVTAIAMAMLTGNRFLFITGIFSFYLAFAGMRFAKNRTGTPQWIDWIAVGLMLLAGVGMWVLAAVYFSNQNNSYMVPAIFGLVALSLGYQDLMTHRHKIATGKNRIARHLTNMLGGTIAVITAVLVVNIDMQPSWIFWLLPTLVITPVIVWWNRKVKG